MPLNAVIATGDNIYRALIKLFIKLDDDFIVEKIAENWWVVWSVRSRSVFVSMRYIVTITMINLIRCML